LKLNPAAQEWWMLQPGDVMKGYPWKAKVIATHNFSWMMFRNRITQRDYFKKCREGLKKDGVLVLDIYEGKATSCQ
jgi:hypothetical protein